MSERDSHVGEPAPELAAEQGPQASQETTQQRPERATERTTAQATGAPDPLRGSRTSGFWVAVVLLVVLLIVLAVFVLQNTQQVQVSFFGWNGTAPLAAALLIATAAGLLIAVSAGALRILQLRRRVRRSQRS
jgi:uncharacterized integral membrane protein